jgi:hypothetical protein
MTRILVAPPAAFTHSTGQGAAMPVQGDTLTMSAVDPSGLMGLGMAKNLLNKRGHRLLVWNRSD